MITIKKYSNRRLYDTSRSSYVNLEELTERVRGGEDIQVVDASTEADLTRAVLVQMILDAPGTLDMLPPALLHRIIRMADPEGLHPIMRTQIAAGFELLEAQLAAFEHQFGGFSAPPPGPPPPPPPPEPSPPDPAPDAPEAPAADPELEALRARLAALESRLER